MERKKNIAASTPEMVTISRTEYESQQAELTELKLQNQWLLEQLGLAKKRQFGVSSERLNTPPPDGHLNRPSQTP